ncbi:thiamine pyrophosphate-dependent enzyme [Streptomyces sp. NPDC059697]|uniref:thiamine pyrophosphate-dependent enzyme n=1 Tax=Streptomyces sp. NPDC059697 TaxID=3346912 RepID=UPI0036AB87D3
MTEAPQFTDAVVGTVSTHAEQLLEMLPSDAPDPTVRGAGLRPVRATEMPGFLHLSIGQASVDRAAGQCGRRLPTARRTRRHHLHAKLRAAGDVVVAFFGDGAVAQGMFHEAVSLAAVWDLPVVFLCENNHYCEFSPAADQHRAPLSARAAGYGIAYEHVDGNDVVGLKASLRAAARVAALSRDREVTAVRPMP